MIKKIALLLFAFAWLTVAPCEVMYAQTSTTNSSARASAPVREVCTILNELTAKLKNGQFDDAQKLGAELEELDKKDVNKQPLTAADKELLKKTLSDFLRTGVMVKLKQEGIDYNTLDANIKSMVDQEISAADKKISDAIDNSKTLEDAGKVLSSVGDM